METASQGTSVKSVDAFTTTAGNTGLQAYRKDAVDFGSDEGASLTVIEKKVPPSSLHAKRQFKSKKQKVKQQSNGSDNIDSSTLRQFKEKKR